MDYPTTEHLLWAVALGAISAVSLPLGSFVGIHTNPRPSAISLLAAFGAGALIAALSVELVAPTLFALEDAVGTSRQGPAYQGFYALVVGAAGGGVLFTALDRLVNARGGFLRRASSTIAYLTARKHGRQMAMLEDLSNFPLLKDLPPEHVNALVGMVLLLWFSLLVITAVGAGAGLLLAESLSHTWVIFAEGLAAGAMLTMIAAAMIPEAVHMGRANAVGLATLTGFIAAISFKLLG